MDKLFLAIIFAFLVFSSGYEDKFRIQPESTKRSPSAELADIILEKSHKGNLGELLLQAGIDEPQKGLPLGLSCKVEPQRIRLYQNSKELSPGEVTELLQWKEMQAIDVCTLVAIMIENETEQRNIVAFDHYNSDFEECGRAFIGKAFVAEDFNIEDGKTSNSTKRILSRKECDKEFSAEAIFALK